MDDINFEPFVVENGRQLGERAQARNIQKKDLQSYHPTIYASHPATFLRNNTMETISKAVADTLDLGNLTKKITADAMENIQTWTRSS